MPNTHSTLTSLFTAIADAIRAKTGSSASIVADDFPDAIAEIPTGTTPGGDNDFVVSLSYNSNSDMWEPDKTFAEILAAYNAGKIIGTYAYDEDIDTEIPSSGIMTGTEFWYAVHKPSQDGYTTTVLAYYMDANGVFVDDEWNTYQTDVASATPADVASGKTFFNVDGLQTGTASGGGGGGASNFVTGTFKGTTTGAAMDVNIPYTGNGYPIALMIYPSEGANKTDGAFGSAIQANAVGVWLAVKNDIETEANYTSNGSSPATTVYTIKSSSTNANSYTRSGSYSTSTLYRKETATAGSNAFVKIKNATTMSVFIASTSYGFMANVEYTYHVVYSE